MIRSISLTHSCWMFGPTCPTEDSTCKEEACPLDHETYRNKLFRLFKKNRLTVSWEALKAQRNRVTSLQRRAKKNYFLHLIRIKAHPSALSNTVKDAGVSNSSHENWSCFNMSSSSVANILNNHFVAVSSTGSGSLPSPPALPSASGIEYLWVSIDSRPFSSPLVFGCF